MDKKVFKQVNARNLRAHVVWVPMLGGSAKHVSAATATFSDRRGRHYWDATGATIRAFRQPLRLNQPAWDVYLIYPAGVRWRDRQPPAPAFWMHQLGRGADQLAPELEPQRFRRALEQALERRRAKKATESAGRQ